MNSPKGYEATGAIEEAVAESALEVAFQIVHLDALVRVIAYVKFRFRLAAVDENGMGNFERACAAFFSIDAADIIAGLVVSMDVRGPVAICDPYVPVATMAFLVDDNGRRCEHAVAVNGQVRLVQSRDTPAVKGHLDHLALLALGLPCISGLFYVLHAIVGDPQIFGVTFFGDCHTVALEYSAVPGRKEIAVRVENKDGGIAWMIADLHVRLDHPT